MTTATLHLKGFDLEPAWPLPYQAASLEAEIAATHVHKDAAERDRDAGDFRACHRIWALDIHLGELHHQLAEVKDRLQNDHHSH